jgi:hypothetical protein
MLASGLPKASRTLACSIFMIFGLTLAAKADVVYPISATASSSFPGYAASNAIDTGPGSNLTDWAAFGTGNGTTLQLDLGAVYSLLTANVTDRVTSGGGNGYLVLGTTDFTTEYSIQAFTNSTFSTPLGAAVDVFATTPASPTGPADFFTQANLTGLTAEYLLYTIISANGPNPGLSDINFTVAAVPEPATWLMLILGFLGLGALSRVREQRFLVAAT